MEEAYSNLNNAYLQIKGMIVVEGFYALVAGFVITTFVFKLAGIIKEMVHEGKKGAFLLQSPAVPCTSTKLSFPI